MPQNFFFKPMATPLERAESTLNSDRAKLDAAEKRLNDFIDNPTIPQGSTYELHSALLEREVYPI